jgi:hypothetical protein
MECSRLNGDMEFCWQPNIREEISLSKKGEDGEARRTLTINDYAMIVKIGTRS